MVGIPSPPILWPKLEVLLPEDTLGAGYKQKEIQMVFNEFLSSFYNRKISFGFFAFQAIYDIQYEKESK